MLTSKIVLHSWIFAADGKWEDALYLPAHPTQDEIRNIIDWVFQAPQNVAFESVFADEDGLPSTMFGVRITCLSKQDQAVRIERILNNAQNITIEEDFLSAFKITFPEFSLFSSKADAINIGVVGQWFSFGEEILWSREHSDTPPLSFAKLLAKAPRFSQPTHNPAAIELWHTQPIDHWYKIYVSEKTNGSANYLIHEEKYQSAIKHLQKLIS